jgi:hypothetical protein
MNPNTDITSNDPLPRDMQQKDTQQRETTQNENQSNDVQATDDQQHDNQYTEEGETYSNIRKYNRHTQSRGEPNRNIYGNERPLTHRDMRNRYNMHHTNYSNMHDPRFTKSRSAKYHDNDNNNYDNNNYDRRDNNRRNDDHDHNREDDHGDNYEDIKNQYSENSMLDLPEYTNFTKYNDTSLTNKVINDLTKKYNSILLTTDPNFNNQRLMKILSNRFGYEMDNLYGDDNYNYEDVDEWHHGFDTGILAALRLINSTLNSTRHACTTYKELQEINGESTDNKPDVDEVNAIRKDLLNIAFSEFPNTESSEN